MQDSIDSKIANNIGLVYKQLYRFHLSKDPNAVSIGYEALYNAILTYNDNKTACFSTYATVCIYNALGTYVRTLNKKRQLDVVSYNSIAYTEDGTNHEFVDLLASPVDVEQNFIKEEKCAMVRKAVQELYNSLSNEKHKAILVLWRDSDYTMQTIKIAERVGVSQPYVSQILGKFKRILKERLEEYYNA